MKKRAKVIIKSEQLERIIERLCFQIIEHHDQFKNSCIVGIQQKGVILSERIIQKLKKLHPSIAIDFGKLDITFFRDDFRSGNKILAPNTMDMNFLIEGKKVILVDDVLYTGRTIQAALQALSNFGRPAKVELLVLIDRRFNRHIPIQADYFGMRVDALDEAYVKVEWKEEDGADRVLFYDSERAAI
ncbi:MAG: bifunctional pyr operon transcriptional regulator/uracil phosphoribosyltransferase PyrR [Saprospiraceae bacterium]|jgi:pyrimidine operon attenuation protein/uracil phosphoribosyltransferase|nr:bifunctional pyr operon transcriptional regulator/uracil phosphoribosyltransferase PyrR [Saprospiraceae bacterium]MBK7468945.1 bifunctional pyr operon transcriptional regulator/uracil phosphoribosyltransferase PyrR [Saprospiraceae bacterium]MBK9995235.1 bifunctional pyr operon transcriptional regulator/uracil phosphoribosyltransferase PyrR [Saprospiraceae bacterium]